MASAALKPSSSPHAAAIDWGAVQREAVPYFQSLLRFNTTNPPGNERPAAEYVAQLLDGDGIASTILESEPTRANLVARLSATASKTEHPLLLSAHLDVVPADAAQWTHPPFSGEIFDGYVWGRGAIDMKHMAIMSVMVLKLLKRNRVPLKRDVIFAAVADEEMGGRKGAGWLVDNHRDLVEAEYALGEVGGFSVEVNGVRFYPIQVAEKGFAWFTMELEGEPGHGSLPPPDAGAMRKLDRVLHNLLTTPLPMHVDPTVRGFIDALAAKQKFPLGQILRQITRPALNRVILDKLFPDRDQARAFHAMLRNTANPTGAYGSKKINVSPPRAGLDIDGRFLPGQTVESFLKEVRAVAGEEVTTTLHYSGDPVVTPTATPLYEVLCQVITDHDPLGIPVPSLTTGFTDAKHFARMGAQWYGFSPMLLDKDIKFMQLFHGIDERLHVDAFQFGIRTLYDAVVRFCAA